MTSWIAKKRRFGCKCRHGSGHTEENTTTQRWESGSGFSADSRSERRSCSANFSKEGGEVERPSRRKTCPPWLIRPARRCFFFSVQRGLISRRKSEREKRFFDATTMGATLLLWSTSCVEENGCCQVSTPALQLRYARHPHPRNVYGARTCQTQNIMNGTDGTIVRFTGHTQMQPLTGPGLPRETFVFVFTPRQRVGLFWWGGRKEGVSVAAGVIANRLLPFLLKGKNQIKLYIYCLPTM